MPSRTRWSRSSRSPGLQLGSLIAFAIITETVFQWPGMGLLFIQAVTFADIPVMAAYLCLIALIFVLINLVVDLLYFAVDPRLRVETIGAGPLIAPDRFHRKATMKKIAPLACMAALTAHATSLAAGVTLARRPNQGDVQSMDPHSLNESLQLSFNGNVYESLVERDKTWA